MALAFKRLPARSLETLYPPIPGHRWFDGHEDLGFDASAGTGASGNRWWLCEHALLAYSEAPEVTAVLAPLYAQTHTLHDRAGSGFAYLAQAHDHAVLALRGTEVFKPGDPWRKLRAVVADWVSDAAIARAPWQGEGRAHRGFAAALAALWPGIEAAVQALPPGLPLYCCGHSLGGALAALCLLRLHASVGADRSLHLLTLGQPAIGDAGCVAALTGHDYARLVHGRDLIARLPPAWMGYRQAGTAIPLDPPAHAAPDAGERRVWSGWLAALTPDWLADHAPLHYSIAAWNAAAAASCGSDAD